MDIKLMREAYVHVRPLCYPPPRMWICPECRRLQLTCEDLGPKKEEHYGWAKQRGQKRPPKCLRHPGVAMTLGDPAR